MSDHDKITFFEKVAELQRRGAGDAGRIAHIRESLLEGRTIYQSDRSYVEKKFAELGAEVQKAGIGRDAESDTRGRMGVSPHKTPEVSGTRRDAHDEVSQNHDEVSRDFTGRPEKKEERSDKITETPVYRSSMAWYFLPVFLGILGGIISYASLRKRHRSRAYKTLGLGTGLSVLFLVFVAGAYSFLESSSAGDQLFDSEIVSADIPDNEIREKALFVPYGELMNNNERYAGETIHFKGQIVQVQERIFGESYIFRIATDTGGFVPGDAIWTNYKQASGGEDVWLKGLTEKINPFGQPDSENMVRIWGISKGIKEYTNIIGGTVKIPEVDILILERFADNMQSNSGELPDAGAGEMQSGMEQDAVLENVEEGADYYRANAERKTLYTISYAEIPEYVDAETPRAALRDAVLEWDEANKDVSFEFVDSDGDLSIEWKKWMPGLRLGVYSAHIIGIGEMEYARHSITIRLGEDDCHSEYRGYSYGSLKHTIAHELGHYLGLRHINYRDHLMYSDDPVARDSVDVYDNRGYIIPEISVPGTRTSAAESVLKEIAALEERIEETLEERRAIKDSYDGDQDALSTNSDAYNALTRDLGGLEDKLECLGG